MQIRRIEIPTPFPVGTVNAYVVGPEPLTLVDCGPRTDEAWQALEAGLSAAGASPRRVERLVLTHPHQDHAGLARRVREVSGCRVLAHPVDHPRFLGRPGVWAGIVGFLVEVCRRAGVPAEVVACLEAHIADMEQYAEALDAVESLDEGGRLAFPEGELRVLHTPGHAQGALSLWDPAGRRLLSGDTLLPHISSNPVLEPASGSFRQRTLPQYLSTLGRLAGLGVQEVLPGHGRPFGDPSALIARRLGRHGERAELLLALVRGGLDRPWELAERLFPGAAPGYSFLAVSEVVGHLDLLADRGALSFEGEAGPWRAVPTGPAP
ncbi:MAG: MBL fold metallo-hydrolase [Deferrisomatales bacterium]